MNLGWPPPLAPPAEFQARRQRPHVVRYTVPRAGHNKNVRTVHAMPVGATARPGRSQAAQPNGSELGNGSLEHMPKPSWPANDPLSDESFRAYPHPPTCTSNSPHRRCHRTGISTACPVGWEWARVGMGVGAGGRRCWPWHGRGACERAPWECGARPSPCHTGHACTHAPPRRHRVAHGTRCVHHATGSRPHSIQTDKRATHQDMHAGTPTHANTQHTTQTHQHHHTTTHHHASTPTPTPPSPHHHHATTSTHTRHTWQRKTYSIHAVKPTHMSKATLSEATSTS